MSKKLNILFVPADATGHVMAAIGIAQVLIEAGHKVTFVINQQWKGRLEKYGIRELLVTIDERAADRDPV